jgi:hypothetical protein
MEKETELAKRLLKENKKDKAKLALRKVLEPTFMPYI